MKQKEINGLLWDVDNFEFAGQKHFTWEEALKYAAIEGKRLPTKREYENLFHYGQKWDANRKGIWFSKKNEGLFFPVWGYFLSDGTFVKYYFNDPCNRIPMEHLWSSTIKSTRISWAVNFNKTIAFLSDEFQLNRYPIRLVQDM